MLRVLVGYSHTHYFMDGLRLRGISAENLRQFEPVLQKGLGNPRPRINVLPLPVARDEMIDFLASGYGDMAIGNITATDERSEQVVFSVPIRRDVSEVIVHGTGVDRVETLDDLAGRTVHFAELAVVVVIAQHRVDPFGFTERRRSGGRQLDEPLAVERQTKLAAHDL